MALKDLVAQKAALTEAAIEEIVASYVRYDVEEVEIIFTSEFGTLSNKAKILVYLSAQQGWQFVSDEATVLGVKPAALGENLGISGGTLRPTLKDLKDRQLIVSKGGSYFVRAASLEAIKSELQDRNAAPRPKTRKRSTSKPGTDGGVNVQTDGGEETEKPKARKTNSSSGGPREKFLDWVDKGYFDEERTLRDVQNRFHEVGIIIPQTSIPELLLRAVRNEMLKREKKKVGNKEVWVYQTSGG